MEVMVEGLRTFNRPSFSSKPVVKRSSLGIPSHPEKNITVEPTEGAILRERDVGAIRQWSYVVDFPPVPHQSFIF
jgi:hypothetical protein